MNCKKFFFMLPFTLMILLAACNKKPKTAESAAPLVLPVASSSVTTQQPEKAAAELPQAIQNKLTGKWQRSDGGYIIEVFSVMEDGRIDAGYFNPNPIHVEKSEWKIAENILYMRVILKDINYPGSTYTLIYNVEKDLLSGNYFQAVEGVNYDVEFRRTIEKK